MRWVWVMIVISMVSGYAFGQYIDPREKATLDYYYENKTNLISGTRIITNTLPVAALDDLDFWLRSDGLNTPSNHMNWGAYKLTNLNDGTYTGTAATVESINAATTGLATVSYVDTQDATLVPTGRTVTINGETKALDANISFTVTADPPTNASFKADMAGANQTLTENTWEKINFTNVQWDTHGWYTATNARWTVQEDGVYAISAKMYKTTGARFTGALYLDGGVYEYIIGYGYNDAGVAVYGASGVQLLNLSSGQYVEAWAIETGTGVVDGQTNISTFAGWKVSP